MDKLPDEIIVNILKYLKTSELIQYCEANIQQQYLLRERKLIENVNLSKEFQFNKVSLLKLINTRLEPNLIRVLNINCLYWIPTTDLIKVITKLNGLKELYALDTKLGLSKNTLIYSRLSKLAVTVTEEDVETGMTQELQSLCIKIVLTKNTFNFQQLFNEKWQLEELWISNEEKVLNYEIIPYILKGLKKLVIRSRSFSPFYDFSHFGLQMIFQCSRNDSEIQFIYEKVPQHVRSVSMFEPIANELEESWEILHRHNKDLSCGPKEAKILYTHGDISNIYFEDLNFGHSIILCQSKYVEAASKVLLSKNSCKLRRLHFRSCLFQRHIEPSTENTSEPSGVEFKKPRVEKTKGTYDPFQKIAQNLKKLNELEIFVCSLCYTNNFFFVITQSVLLRTLRN